MGMKGLDFKPSKPCKMLPEDQQEIDPITGGKHGDMVCVTMKKRNGDEFHQLYTLVLMMNGAWPDNSQGWYLKKPLYFLFLVLQLKEWGAEFRVIHP